MAVSSKNTNLQSCSLGYEGLQILT